MDKSLSNTEPRAYLQSLGIAPMEVNFGFEFHCAPHVVIVQPISHWLDFVQGSIRIYRTSDSFIVCTEVDKIGFLIEKRKKVYNYTIIHILKNRSLDRIYYWIRSFFQFHSRFGL
jgi:hypothetical protein